MAVQLATAKSVLAEIAARGIELAVERGHLDPATATEGQILAVGEAVLMMAVEANDDVRKLLTELVAEEFHARVNGTTYIQSLFEPTSLTGRW